MKESSCGLPGSFSKFCFFYYDLLMQLPQIILCSVNDENLVGLKFGESANKSVWQKKVWQIHPELQVCMDIRLIFAIGE